MLGPDRESLGASDGTQQFTATGPFGRQFHTEFDDQCYLDVVDHDHGDDQPCGLGVCVEIGKHHYFATSGSVSGSSTLTVTAATLAFIAIPPVNPSVAAGKDAAVHSEWDVV